MRQLSSLPRIAAMLLFPALLSVPMPAQAGEDLRARYEITVFSDDTALADRVLARLRQLGYTNPENGRQSSPNDNLNIKFGKDAPASMITEIAGSVETMVGAPLIRKKIFARGDRDIFINLPSSQVRHAAGPASPAAYKVKIFTDDPAVGRAALTALEAVGFTNPDNAVRKRPNADFNIKWGAASPALIDKAASVIEPMIGTPLARKKIFDADDTDIFINLPVAASRSTDRSAWEVTIFSDHPATADRVMKVLVAMGYDNPRNTVMGSPNRDFNIKWGGASPAHVDELSTVVGGMVGQALVRKPIFEADNRKIFINLPLCASGGDGRPVDCR